MYLKNRIEVAYIDKSEQDADGYEKNTERRLPLWAHAESSESSGSMLCARGLLSAVANLSTTAKRNCR